MRGELPNLGGANPDALSVVTDTIKTLVGQAEDAKGSLRGLRDLAGG